MASPFLYIKVFTVEKRPHGGYVSFFGLLQKPPGLRKIKSSYPPSFAKCFAKCFAYGAFFDKMLFFIENF